MDDNRPLSQIYQQAAEEWVDKEAAADLLENMKSVVMAQRQSAMGDIPVNRAEQAVKSSPFWEKYVRDVAEARKQANLAKVKLEEIRMRHTEWVNGQANMRAEMKL